MKPKIFFIKLQGSNFRNEKPRANFFIPSQISAFLFEALGINGESPKNGKKIMLKKILMHVSL